MRDTARQAARVHSSVFLRLVAAAPWETALLDSIRLHEVTAPARFHDRFAREAHKLVRALIGPDVAAPMVVSRALLAAYVKLERGRVSPGPLAHLVEQHLVSGASTYLRRRRLASYLPGRRQAQFESNAMAHVVRFYTLLRRFPAVQQLAFCLQYVASRRRSETASLLRCSVMDVRSSVKNVEECLERA